MILKDFKTGGFPISANVPVLCIDEKYALHVAYNRVDLAKILKGNDIKCCYGVWPGKKNTDCFILDIESYAKMPAPPEAHKEIDVAEQVTLYLDEDNNFSKIAYRTTKGDFQIVSRDPALLDYIKKMGLKYITVSEDEICPHCTNGRNVLSDSLGSINKICDVCHGTGKI
jgi:hypothetical protein